MTPTSHKGARPVGRDARESAAATHPVPGAWRPDFTDGPATSVLALASRTANQALSRQIEFAFDVGRALREQSRAIEQTANRSLPAGPWRDALTEVARMQAGFADIVVAQSLQWGRHFGGLAFAFPLPDRAS